MPNEYQGMSDSPDRLVLSKSDILAFCDRILTKWGKDAEANALNIIAMNAIKTSVIWTDEQTLKAVWGEITEWLFQLLYENAMAQAEQEGVKWPDMLRQAGQRQ